MTNIGTGLLWLKEAPQRTKRMILSHWHGFTSHCLWCHFFNCNQIISFKLLTKLIKFSSARLRTAEIKLLRQKRLQDKILQLSRSTFSVSLMLHHRLRMQTYWFYSASVFKPQGIRFQWLQHCFVFVRYSKLLVASSTS